MLRFSFLFLLSLPLFAQGNYEVQVYGSDTVPPGQLMVELHSNFTAKGQMQTALNWTTFGFVDDTPEMKTRRLRQNNLAGPAGYVSMEDGAVGGFVQRGVAAASGERAVVEMGGSGTTGQGTRATEASVRGFWKCYRGLMGI